MLTSSATSRRPGSPVTSTNDIRLVTLTDLAAPGRPSPSSSSSARANVPLGQRVRSPSSHCSRRRRPAGRCRQSQPVGRPCWMASAVHRCERPPHRRRCLADSGRVSCEGRRRKFPSSPHLGGQRREREQGRATPIRLVERRLQHSVGHRRVVEYRDHPSIGGGRSRGVTHADDGHGAKCRLGDNGRGDTAAGGF